MFAILVNLKDVQNALMVVVHVSQVPSCSTHCCEGNARGAYGPLIDGVSRIRIQETLLLCLRNTQWVGRWLLLTDYYRIYHVESDPVFGAATATVEELRPIE